MFEEAYSLIEKYDTICVCGHIKPDGDSYGSTFGLVSFLKSLYPNKNIYCVGDDGGRCREIFPELDVIDEEVFFDALAIFCDTSSKDRCADYRMYLCSENIKFDHHDGSEDLGGLAYVDPKLASCAELIAKFTDERVAMEKLGLATATYLYTGILTDSKQFTTTASTSETLYTASRLAANGINLCKLNTTIFSMDSNKFAMISDFRNMVEINEHQIAYGICSREFMDKHQVSYNEAKDLINVFDEIKSIKAWVMFIEDEEHTDHAYNGSLRSRGLVINELAKKYGGGGHKQAAGTGYIYPNHFSDLISDLNELADNYQED